MTEFAKGKNNRVNVVIIAIEAGKRLDEFQSPNNRVNVVIYNVSTKGVAPEGFNPLF
ncbi:hypothetical protein [Aliarcobacter skirrowii]|uniref:hypothetical protein n=1 Tax=Aliarcobacter skirrowii TaxID=28200 RepID=UPI002A366DAF|nr:hypothetical protein [Aliarcobacter skirrowii]MDY0181463.1 hypothetical protein [Aliarcobacter skirrowii]